MIQAVIFSMDRPLQLHLLLSSIQLYGGSGYFNISVLYATSSPEFEIGYDKLKKKFPQVSWVLEESFPPRVEFPLHSFYWHNFYWWLRYKTSRQVRSKFRKQLIEITQRTAERYIMFLTDDSMFYRTIHVPPRVLDIIENSPRHSSFSLRHGANIFGGNYERDKDMLQWNVYRDQRHPEWNYPFSVDGHIYNKNFMIRALKKVAFKNPNSLEGNLCCYIRERKYLSGIYSNETSSLVGFELNRVQNMSNNHNLGISGRYLNSLFGEGYTMQIEFDEHQNRLFRPDKFSVNASREDSCINIVTIN